MLILFMFRTLRDKPTKLRPGKILLICHAASILKSEPVLSFRGTLLTFFRGKAKIILYNGVISRELSLEMPVVLQSTTSQLPIMGSRDHSTQNYSRMCHLASSQLVPI